MVQYSTHAQLRYRRDGPQRPALATPVGSAERSKVHGNRRQSNQNQTHFTPQESNKLPLASKTTKHLLSVYLLCELLSLNAALFRFFFYWEYKV